MSNDNKQDTSSKVTDPKQLTTIYKKNGTFDAKRKELLSNFKESETCNNLLLKLRIMVESKIKADPLILMKNKGKMAALIQGEIVNRSNINDPASSSSSDSKNDTGILSIVDKDIQEKIIDSSQFHELLREELMDVQRKIMGISDEEFEKMKTELRMKKEQREQEVLKRNARLEKEKLQMDYRNNFKVKDLTNGHAATNGHRVNKAPRFNLKSSTDGDRPDAKKVEKKKVTKMMY
ncbi:hypothetical protein CANMA_001429 [Candida margitis]|uniref:uncharacterized protein n=1 Tax=Candida margitis TaxID=1775924 RepID=UPI002225F335|nr:uncharacterized protein CANMA_001429 [Candida margitis]KAI5969362.1 hypothetical protein CANMA_001429 [Candida margitis]